jgi:hypothetical protein
MLYSNHIDSFYATSSSIRQTPLIFELFETLSINQSIHHPHYLLCDLFRAVKSIVSPLIVSQPSLFLLAYSKRKEEITMSSEEQKTEDPTSVALEELEVVVDEEAAVAVALTSAEAPAAGDAATKPEASSEVITEEVNDEPKRTHMKVAADAPWKDRMWEVFSTFWPLGLIAFGGPQVSCLREYVLSYIM